MLFMFVRREPADAEGNGDLSICLNAAEGSLAEEIDRLVHLGAAFGTSHDRGR
jgi:hypothetical protein